MDELHDTLRQLVKTHEEAYLKEVEETRRLRKIIEDKKFPENVRQAEYAKMLEAAEVRIQEIVEERVQEVYDDLDEARQENTRLEAAHRKATKAQRDFWIFMTLLAGVAGAVIF